MIPRNHPTPYLVRSSAEPTPTSATTTVASKDIPAQVADLSPPPPAVQVAPHKLEPAAGSNVLPFSPTGKKKADSKHSMPPVNDVHFHPSNYVHQGPSLPTLLRMMDEQGMHRTVLCPIPTRQMQCDDHTLYRPALGKPSHGCNYYIAEPHIRKDTKVSKEEYWDSVLRSPSLAHDTECDWHTATAYQALSTAQKDRFDPMITGLNLGDVRCSDSLIRKLDNSPGVFTGVGEITVHKEVVQEKLPKEHQARLVPIVHQGRTLDPHTAALKKLIVTCGDIGMPMIIHNDAGPIDALRTRPEDSTLYFDPAVALYRQPECRNTTIIWAHAGGAGKYSHIDDRHVERLEALLSDPELRHVHFDLSWDVVAHQLTRDDGTAGGSFDKAKAARWAALLDKYPDRILFGSDSLAPACHEHWKSTADAYEGLLSMVKPETARKVRHDNYERLIVGSRARVRAWEKYCLPIAVKPLKMRNDSFVSHIPYEKAFAAAVSQAAVDMPVARLAMELDLAQGDANAPAAKKQLDGIRSNASTRAIATGSTVEEAHATGIMAAQKALAAARTLVAGSAPVSSRSPAVEAPPLRARL